MSYATKSLEGRDWLIPIVVTTAFAAFFLHTQLVAPWLLRRQVDTEPRREEIDRKIAKARSELEYFKNMQSQLNAHDSELATTRASGKGGSTDEISSGVNDQASKKARKEPEDQQERHRQEELIKSSALRTEYQQRISGIEAEIERLKQQR